MMSDILRLCSLHNYRCEVVGNFVQVFAPMGFLVGQSIFHSILADRDDIGEMSNLLLDVGSPASRCDDPACETCGRTPEIESPFEVDEPDGRSVNSDLAW